jgi:hypothetical protein
MRKDTTMASSLTTYTIDITMDPTTVSELQQGNFLLYGFTGVDGPPAGTPPTAYPTVWFNTSSYSANTTVQWEEQYGGYTSTQTNPVPGTTIDASFSTDMSLGQQLNVTAGGVGTVVPGTSGEIVINNTTTTQFTCGLTLQNPASSTSPGTPICAFPLFGMMADSFIPVEIVLLMFATNQDDTGTVIETSFSDGILVNMTGQTSAVSLTFDINGGWSGPVDITSILPAGSSLVESLLNPASLPGTKATRHRARAAAGRR